MTEFFSGLNSLSVWQWLGLIAIAGMFRLVTVKIKIGE